MSVDEGIRVRPRAVTTAVTATVLNGIIGVIFSITWPDLEDRATIVTVSIILGALMIGSALLLWYGAHRGAFATIAVNVINILLGIPTFADGTLALVLFVAVLFSIVLSGVAIMAILTPAARSFWGRRG